MKKILALFTVLTLVFTSVTVSASGLSIFSDVDITTDEGIAVYTLYAEGIVKGYGDGTFGINNSLTRAECSRMINLLFKFTDAGENIFSDVSPDDWFYDDVNIAVKAGFIVGFEDLTFRGNEPVTRQQACSIVNRIAKPEAKLDLKITDTVDDWAKDDVKAIVDAGLLKLEDGDTFRATENMTRGELALLLVNFIDNSDYTVDVPENKPLDEEKSETEDNKSQGNTSSGGSSSSGGSISSGGSSSSGSGSGSADNKPSNPTEPAEPTEPTFDNTEVIANLKAVLAEIESETFIGAEKEIISIVKKDIELTIEAGETEFIDENYVNDHFAEDVTKARGIYTEMSKAAKDRFLEKIAGFDTNTLAFLQGYFIEKE